MKSAMKKNCSPRQMIRATKNVPKQKDFSRTEQGYVSRTALEVNTTDTRLDLLIASWITAHIGCRPSAAWASTTNNQLPSVKSGTQ